MLNKNQFFMDPAVIELRNLSLDDDFDTNSDERVELLVTASTFDGLPDHLLRVDNQMYDIRDINSVNNPAFEELRHLYGELSPSDRVEVLVFDDHNHLKHALHDAPVSPYMRGLQKVSKHAETISRLINQVNETAQNLQIQPLRVDEVDKAEQAMDQIVVSALRTNSAF